MEQVKEQSCEALTWDEEGEDCTCGKTATHIGDPNQKKFRTFLCQEHAAAYHPARVRVIVPDNQQ